MNLALKGLIGDVGGSFVSALPLGRYLFLFQNYSPTKEESSLLTPELASAGTYVLISLRGTYVPTSLRGSCVPISLRTYVTINISWGICNPYTILFWGRIPYLQGPRETPYPAGHKFGCLEAISPLRPYLHNLAFHP